MTHIPDAASAEAALHACASDPDTRILRRVHDLQKFPLAERKDGPFRRVMLVDTETTGTDPAIDEIIDIALVMIEVDTRGEIVGILSSGEALRDPGMPIPAIISRLTGIHDEDVRGKVINLDRLEDRLLLADVLIAHNAVFDLGFLLQLMPNLSKTAWACSASDFDWAGLGFDGRRLGHLLMQIGHFNEAHRAMADVVSLLHLLAHRLPSGQTVLGTLLHNAEKPTIRIEATGAPFGKRGALKARGYRWDPQHKVWWRELPPEACAWEELWLHRNVTPDGPAPQMLPVTWHQRHR